MQSITMEQYIVLMDHKACAALWRGDLCYGLEHAVDQLNAGWQHLWLLTGNLMFLECIIPEYACSAISS